MTVMVALLRGVNVGGRAGLAMADLRAVAAARGYERPRTYIQSGNLVFSAPEGTTRDVASDLRQGIVEATNLDPAVIVRTRDELAAVIAESPYVARGEDAAHLHVLFLDDDVAVPGDPGDLSARAPEEATALGRHVHLFLPKGVGRSRLAADVARRYGGAGTMRNWRTVTKLLEMADET